MNRPMSIKELHGILTMYGWVQLRQRGSHVIYGKNGQTLGLVMHRAMRGEVSWQTAKKIIKKARGERVNKG